MFFILPSALVNVSCSLPSALMHFAVSSTEGEWVTRENAGGGSMTEVPEDDWILMLLTKPSQLKDQPQSFCQHR